MVKRILNMVFILFKKSKGNFLFVKEVFFYCEFLRCNLSDVFILLNILGDMYYGYFERFYFYIIKGSFKIV